MKKLVLLLLAYSAITTAQPLQVYKDIANPVRQGQQTASTQKPAAAMVNDTLDYYFNKHYYRNNAATHLSFYTIKSPYQSNIGISHCGAVFKNATTISVHGLAGLVIRNVTSPSPSVPVHLYLCTVGAGNLPAWPPVDSVLTSVSTSTAGVWVGGTFASPHTVTGDFAVLLKVGPSVAGDTVRLFLNNACSPTSTVAAHTSAQKYGEGLGLIRFNGNFQSNTNTFGNGTDYEFVVSPYISFQMNAGATALTPTICLGSIGNFGNSSTPMNALENRQFNFNKFTASWKPFLFAPLATDSIYNWSFPGANPATSTQKQPSTTYGSFGNQLASLTTRYRRSAVGYTSSTIQDVSQAALYVENGTTPFTIVGQTDFCSNTAITTTLQVFGNGTFTWSSPNTIGQTFVANPSATTVYTVVTNSGGCLAMKTVTVFVNPLPAVNLTAAKNTVCVGSGSSSTVALTGSPSGGFYTGTNVGGSKFTANTVGTFTATYSYTNTQTSCTNSATTVIDVLACTGLDPAAALQLPMLYPNPTQNGVSFIINLEGENHIEVFDLLGKKVLEVNAEKAEQRISLQGQPAGQYFVRITGENGSSRFLKLVNQP